jgi:transcriptional/translational regulatory protein YebC/TACO1
MSARQQNMPGDNIERAIKKGTGELEGVNYEEITYEGYGPGGAAVIVEVVTDNKQRTLSEVRHSFMAHNGNLGANGCVAWNFETKGLLVVAKGKMDEDQLMELRSRPAPTTSATPGRISRSSPTRGSSRT